MSPTLRLVRSRRDHAFIGGVRLSLVAPHDVSPCDAVVLEEDTWQVVAAGPGPSASIEHPIRVWTAVLNAKPLPVGTVLRREGCPLAMRAIVYDFERVPCCRSTWIKSALAEVFRICRERHSRSLILPLLGVRHGRISVQEAFRLVTCAIRDHAHGGLCRVLLGCPPEVEEKLRQLIHRAAPPMASSPGSNFP